MAFSKSLSIPKIKSGLINFRLGIIHDDLKLDGSLVVKHSACHVFLSLDKYTVVRKNTT